MQNNANETVRHTADVVLLADHADGIHVLLIQRGHYPYAGYFALPGGHVDPGEDAEDAARRELAEETGIQAASLDLVGVYDKPGRDPRGAYSTTAYVGLLDRVIEPTAGDDADAAGWFPLVSALSVMDLAFDHGQILADARGALPCAPGGRDSLSTSRRTVRAGEGERATTWASSTGVASSTTVAT